MMHLVEVKECPQQVLFAVLFITQPGKNNKTCGEESKVEGRKENSKFRRDDRETVLLPSVTLLCATPV